MPTNPSIHYEKAEQEFHLAETKQQKIRALKKMISLAPSHKGAETLRARLKKRLKKLKYGEEKQKTQVKAGKDGIKKHDMQAVLLGLTNTGKSSLLKALTNANPVIASYGFTTKAAEQGILNYEGCQIQIIDLPPISSENFDQGITNTADTILVVIEKIHEIPEIKEILKKAKGKQIIVFNKIDLYNQETKRKIKETLKSKRYNFVMISTLTNEGLEELKEKLFKSFNKIRVYTKEPNKSQADKEPMIMLPNSTVQEAAEKILHGFSKNIKRTRIWGPSSKFAGQRVGLKHLLKDKDILEFITK